MIKKTEEIKKYFEAEIRTLMTELAETKVKLNYKEEELERLTSVVSSQELTIELLKANVATKVAPLVRVIVSRWVVMCIA